MKNEVNFNLIPRDRVQIKLTANKDAIVYLKIEQ